MPIALERMLESLVFLQRFSTVAVALHGRHRMKAGLLKADV